MFTDTPTYLGLLLFLAAALGWLFAKLPNRTNHGSGKPISREYYKGLNFLLAEKPDKALEVFIRMVEVDSETVETHFALGSLFRRRGEVDRAIRVHQNLIARPNLKREFKTQALFALGEDYMKAGLFDRAENLFLELSRDRRFQRDALNHLVAIYEQQKDWDQAVTAFRQLESATGEYRGDVISHYFCELAQVAIDAKDKKNAQRLARKALSFDRSSGRPNIIAGDISAANGKNRDAMKHYRHALGKDIRLSLEVLPRVLATMEVSGSHDINGFVKEISESHPHANTCIAVTALLHPEIDGTSVEFAVKEFLNGSEQLRNLHKMLREFGVDDVSSERQSTNSIKRCLRQLVRMDALYRCEQCGYTGSMLHWQCPSCRQWNTTHPHLDFSFTGNHDLTGNGQK